MWRLGRWLGAGLLLAAAAHGRAEAHPHVWVDYQVTLQFQKGKVVALREDWTFDEDFTAAVLRDVAGKEQVAALSPGDVAKLKQDAFDNLKNYGYFTHVWEGDTPVDAKESGEFLARLAAGRLAYAFSLSLARPVDAKGAPASFGIWDDSYYVDMEPAKNNAVTLEGDHPASCRAAIVTDHQHAIYFGSVFPMIIRVSC